MWVYDILTTTEGPLRLMSHKQLKTTYSIIIMLMEFYGILTEMPQEWQKILEKNVNVLVEETKDCS